MKFSIITPSYNQGQYIGQTIESVWKQKGDFLIEHIIADGGSTDNTLEIIKQYEKTTPTHVTLKWWSHADSGQADAINQGFQSGKGDIYAWINSDDFYEPDVFQKVAKYFHQNPAIDLLYGCCHQVDEVNNLWSTLLVHQTNYDELRNYWNMIPQPGAFFSKRIIQQIGLLDNSLHYAFDYEYFIRIAQAGQLQACPQEVFANFRIWENSKSHAKINEFAKERKLIRRRYRGKIIDLKEMYKLSAKYRIFVWFNHHFPYLYSLVRKVFFWVFNKLTY